MAGIIDCTGYNPYCLLLASTRPRCCMYKINNTTGIASQMYQQVPMQHS